MIDETDKKILRILQKDARTKYTEISKSLKIPVSTIFKRVGKLERDGIIEGYTVKINAEKVDKGLTTFIIAQARRDNDLKFDEIGAELSKVKNVQEVFTVTGEFDFLVKMKVKDIDDYYKSVEGVARKLGAKGGGLIVTKKFKESTELL